jgi:hypothetical protein|tara:strand:+ start:400 stop:594 length:195 start_codon:yes stop_codon:yes gene_type:complete
LDGLYISEKLLKIIKSRIESIKETLAHGAVKDFDSFKELRAKLNELAYIEQELKSLLEGVTEDD